MNPPRVAVARYVAIGCVSSHTKVRLSPVVVLDTSTPLPTTSMSVGTVMASVKEALSLGWLLLGNQPMLPIGSPTTKAPSTVGRKPSDDPSGSMISGGVPL